MYPLVGHTDVGAHEYPTGMYPLVADRQVEATGRKKVARRVGQAVKVIRR